MIRLDNLTKRFTTREGTATAADHINMEVAAGEICILLGPSGCGKTTTLKMVNRIIPPSSGRVFLDGKDTTDYDTIALRRQIGYVIQQIGLFPNMTVGENIGVVPRLLGWDRQRIRRRTASLLEMVALDPAIFLDRYPKELSGGQQQRIGVARALAADPPVLLMDEPFGAIDPINRQVIQDEFLKMQEKLGKTILFVSHDIDEAVKMGDKIAIFREGRLQQFDTPNQVLAHPANDFVADFVGGDRTLKRLRLITVRQAMRPADRALLSAREMNRPGVSIGADDDLRLAVSRMLTHGLDALAVVVDDGACCGIITHQAIREALRTDDGPAAREARP
ncbi:ABC transporter ATP-binding protein [Castellaniella hirudinis]|uniref:ABC transporter ATP-binding protein n=1 Tax=Castellaniella hirudinis TaxID=1144617 RepID=UPI0039C0ACD0